jgi:hypothetical protein
MTLAGNTVYPYSSIDANFDPPQFRLDSTFNDDISLLFLLVIYYLNTLITPYHAAFSRVAIQVWVLLTLSYSSKINGYLHPQRVSPPLKKTL